MTTIALHLDGQSFAALNGGPVFKFNGAGSIQVNCSTHDETDYYWNKLSAGGDPKAHACGWLKDKIGLSWQFVPSFTHFAERMMKSEWSVTLK